MKAQFKIASTQRDLATVKKLDDQAFGEHHGISMIELNELMNKGIVYMLYDTDGQLVGEAQLALYELSMIPYGIGVNDAFFYGVGIRPNSQGMGWGRMLMEEMENDSINNDRRKFHMTVRLENYASIRMCMKHGFKIVGYDRKFYGHNPATDARVIMAKTAGDNALDDINALQTEVLDVCFDGAYNPATHKRLDYLLSHGYIGVAIDRQKISFCKIF